MGKKRKNERHGGNGARITLADRLGDRLYIWAAVHIGRLPYFVSGWLGKRFDLGAFTSRTCDPMPRRLLFKSIYRPPVKEDGTYIYGRAPITVGQRFKALQAIQRGDIAAALCAFYGIPKWYLVFGSFDKVNRLACYLSEDLRAREERDRKLQTPLTDLQKRAGYDRLNFGLFGVIDYVSTRNGLKYGEVEELRDETLCAILKIDHDRERVRRKEMELQADEQNRKMKQRRTR